MYTDKINGRVYDIQDYSVQDGPGIRTTVFLKGCPLRCPWCHSPESQKFQPQVCYMDMRCIGVEKCGSCLDKCPQEALKVSEPTYSPSQKCDIRTIVLDRSKCDDCGKCAQVCHPDALFVSGREYTVDEVMTRIKKQADYFKRSGGGITVSGGEPLCQPIFTQAVFKACKKENIGTALDTTGYVGRDSIDMVLPYTDLFLFDLKHMDSRMHKAVIGVPNELIHENARYIASMGGKFQIRVPVIPGFNDMPKNLHATAQLCRELGEAVTEVQLLPFHRLGAVKYDRLQMDFPMPEDILPPSAEVMQEHAKLFESYGIHTVIH